MFLIVGSITSYAQCAMCRATLENNVSNGEPGIGASINFGILYLFVMPYLLISVIGYFWYKKSKSNESKKQIFRSFIK
jgi:hypothetical protein